MLFGIPFLKLISPKLLRNIKNTPLINIFSRPNGVKYNSPGQRPGGERGKRITSPERAEYLPVPVRSVHLYFAPSGLDSVVFFPRGRCPGLVYSALSGLAGYESMNRDCPGNIRILVLCTG